MSMLTPSISRDLQHDGHTPRGVVEDMAADARFNFMCVRILTSSHHIWHEP